MIDRSLLIESCIDSLEVFPFLLIAYLLLEYLEKIIKVRPLGWLKHNGFWGPIIGSMVGIIPQCGFSAAISNFYVARAVSLGTLIAVYMTTSDEMIPLLISNSVAPTVIGKIIGLKLLLGLGGGLVCDVLWRDKRDLNVECLCRQEDCHCENETGILGPAIRHACKITAFLLVFMLVFNLLMAQTPLKAEILKQPVIGEMIAAAIGLIPNCSSSVAITRLWIEGAIPASALITGLSAGGGVGLLVLFRLNRNRSENIKIAFILYGAAVLSGLVVRILQINL